MAVAAIYDIHGNLPALEAVLDEVRGLEVDGIVVGGDVFPGPIPRETLELLLALNVPVQFIRGNGDRAVLAVMRGKELDPMPEQARESVHWVARQLSAEHERLLASWPETLSLQIEGVGKALFCHATPKSDTEIFTRITPEERFLAVFDGLEAATIVCGHTHMQFDRMVGHVRVLNAGSVGMPFGEPGAYWLLLGPEVRMRRTAYNLLEAAARVLRTEYPQAEEFAEHNILHPPSEEEMLAAFAKFEVGQR
jgi:predicted phosphodiesterase